MAYKNFILRSFMSLFITFITIFFLYYNEYLLYFVYLVYLGILIEVFLFFRKKINIFIYSCIYVIISFFLFNLYFIYNFNLREFIFTIIIIVIFDSFSYFFGSIFGKFKILPKISPNKTLTGLLSGLIFSFTTGFILNLYYEFFNTISLFIYLSLILFASFLGDVFESILKRKSSIKNSSEILPGHGGIFDRFDSYVMVFVFLYFIKLIY